MSDNELLPVRKSRQRQLVCAFVSLRGGRQQPIYHWAYFRGALPRPVKSVDIEVEVARLVMRQRNCSASEAAQYMAEKKVKMEKLPEAWIPELAANILAQLDKGV